MTDDIARSIPVSVRYNVTRYNDTLKSKKTFKKIFLKTFKTFKNLKT